MTQAIGEQSTLAADDPMGVAPRARPEGDLVLEAQRAKVFGALSTKPALRRMGRYVVLDVLGQGGMGVVLKGYDDELDRQVAIKVLHAELDERHTARLRREAQAMAKISHPNVVQVYEVGELEGQTFVAMELCKGRTLRDWMQQEPRPGWKACVEVFLQLGQGLAAAHKRGLVHRDFKPGNAILDDEGRARVLDFGLARRGEADDDEPSTMIEQARADAHAAIPLETSLTETGAVLGTPAYIPPEQMGGLEADARSDQFSFCVALYEAVYGERPYEGSSMMALLVSMRSGTVRPAPKGSDVPLALRKLLLRGLAVDPEQRWPSMEGLLEELRRIVAPRRRRWMVLGVTAGLLAVGGGLGTTRMLEWKNRCTGAYEQLEGAWDDARRQAVQTAILATGLSYAPGTWERVEPQLDAYADAWATEHTDACKATRLRDEQSEEDMSLRMGCLHERRQHLRATVHELSHADATVVENAVQAVASLPRFERCRDLEALRAEVPPPEDPGVAERVEALDELLVEAKAKREAGKYDDGLQLADDVVEEGAALGYEPLMARAWLRQGNLQMECGEYEDAAEALRKAYGAAVAHTMKPEAAGSSSQLMFVSSRLARHEEARGWAEHAEPLSRAMGTDEARADYLNSLGFVAFSQAEHEEARASHERALAIREKALGPDHPYVAASLTNLGTTAYVQGKYEEAHTFHERALAIREKALGPDHPHVAASLTGLGNAAYVQGKYEEARTFHERALAIREKALGPDHPHVATSLDNLGHAAFLQGKYEEARASYERALAIKEKALGPDHPDVAGSLNNLGTTAYSQGKHEEARAFQERALALWEKALGPDHPHVTYPLTVLGKSLLGLAKPGDALPLLERALLIRTTHGVDPAAVAETRFALARALWTAPATEGRDRPRARTLAAQAHDAYVSLGDATKAELAEVQTWLAEHRIP